jgi:TolB-like protein
MCKYISLVLLIGLAWGKTTIAVLDFEGKGIPKSETSILTDRLRNEVFKTGVFVVLERGQMDDVLKEQGFQQTGCISSECAIEVGRMLGVQQMVAGSIGKVGSVYTVSARIFDVETGKILKSADYDHIGVIDELLVNGMKVVTYDLLNLKINKQRSSSSFSTLKVEQNNSDNLKQSFEDMKIKRKKDSEYNESKISIIKIKNGQKLQEPIIMHGNTILKSVEFYRKIGLNAEANKIENDYKSLLLKYENKPYDLIKVKNPIYVMTKQLIGSGMILFAFFNSDLEPAVEVQLVMLGSTTLLFGEKIIKFPKIDKKIPKKKPVLKLRLSSDEIDKLAENYNSNLYNRIFK